MSKAVARKSPGKSNGKLAGTAHDDKRQEIIERCAGLFDGGYLGWFGVGGMD